MFDSNIDTGTQPNILSSGMSVGAISVLLQDVGEAATDDDAEHIYVKQEVFGRRLEQFGGEIRAVTAAGSLFAKGAESPFFLADLSVTKEL